MSLISELPIQILVLACILVLCGITWMSLSLRSLIIMWAKQARKTCKKRKRRNSDAIN